VDAVKFGDQPPLTEAAFVINGLPFLGYCEVFELAAGLTQDGSERQMIGAQSQEMRDRKAAPHPF
jgi:hypothetical protein